jgi:hypothetical protein
LLVMGLCCKKVSTMTKLHLKKTIYDETLYFS